MTSEGPRPFSIDLQVFHPKVIGFGRSFCRAFKNLWKGTTISN